MAEIETDTDGIQVADAEDFDQVAGGCGFAEQVFDEQAHAERMGEGGAPAIGDPPLEFHASRCERALGGVVCLC